jgi:Domain of unknown function (DUF4863)
MPKSSSPAAKTSLLKSKICKAFDSAEGTLQLTDFPQNSRQDLEACLNTGYGPGNAYYEDFCRYTKQGLDESWVAATELDGRKYRRGKIALPSTESRYFSITGLTLGISLVETISKKGSGQ